MNALFSLKADEPPPVEVINPEGKSAAVLLCDHASPRVPRALGDLGLLPEQLHDHIGWDPGAADVARALSARLDAPLVLPGYSRLCIDCNRPPGVASSIPTHSGGIAIPGNADVSPLERQARQEALFWPYHRAIAGLLDARRSAALRATGRRRAAQRPTAVLSLHSFTPVLLGTARPWHVGFMYGTDRRLAQRFLTRFAADAELCVGDNLPYQVTPETDYSIPHHGEARGLPCVLIELRNDGVRTPAGVAAWAARLALAWEAMDDLSASTGGATG